MDIKLQQQLALLFPKSNKALEKVLEKATPEQLKTLSEAKDLKAVLTQLMTDTLDPSKSNKIILDILKNSTFFKELGSFPKELKTLVELLTNLEKEQSKDSKTDNIEKILKTLKTSLLDFSSSDSTKLKAFIKDSGVFLESKLVKESSQNLELKSSLTQLKNILEKSEVSGSKEVLKNLDKLLQNPKSFEAIQTTSAETKKEIQQILSQIKNISKQVDPIFSKDIEKLVTKLENSIQNKQINNEKVNINEVKTQVSELKSELRVSTKDSIKTLVQNLEKIETKIQNIIKENKTQPLLKSLKVELENLIKTPSLGIDTKNIKEVIHKIEQLLKLSFNDLQNINQNELKTYFATISDKFPQTTSKSVFDIIEKILSSLKQPQVGFEQKKIPLDIKNFLASFEKELSKADVVFSKHTQKTVDKISMFLKMPQDINKTLIQQDIQKDIKALLLGLEKEVSTNQTSISNSNDILKSVDKLLVQLDYFQLLSHLSNSSALYIPYSWDQLEDGKLSMKQSKDGSFFCEIDLELKEFGKLNMMLQLFEKNQLNIMIYTQKDELKDIFKDNMKDLRAALTSVNIQPRNIKLHKLSETEKKQQIYGEVEELHELGFEVKG